MNVSLPEDLKAFVDEQVVQRSYATTSEYVRALLRRERDIATLRETVLVGAPGPYAAMDDAYFARLRQAATVPAPAQ